MVLKFTNLKKSRKDTDDMDGDFFKDINKFSVNKTMPVTTSKPASIIQRNKSEREYEL